MINLLKVKKWQKIIKNSDLFDAKFYLFENPDVRTADVDPVKHFLEYGASQGLNPSKNFNTIFYLEQNSDVRESGVNPLVHYILLGKDEGRLKNKDELNAQIIEKSGLFDKIYYLSTYPDVKEAGVDPLRHFVEYGASEGRNPSAEFDTAFYLEQNRDIRESAFNPLVHYILYGKEEGRLKNNDELNARIIEESGLFDKTYYLSTYPDVKEAGVDPLRHFVEYGASEGRNPSAEFDTAFYLEQNRDIRESAFNPLVHYILYGKEEGRLKNNDELNARIIEESGLFDKTYYLSTYPDVKEAGVDPLRHFIEYGASEGRNPSAEFDTAFYLEQNRDIRESAFNPLVHYILYGKEEGRLKNNDELNARIIEESGLFDKTYYLSTYPDVKEAGVDPLRHFVEYGASEGRNPSAEFDTAFYLEQNRDIRESAFNPLVHYILYGKEEGRLIKVEPIINVTEFVEYEKHEPINCCVRALAFYLPQFHPIQENDLWWGKGFTEWTNTAKARPLFPGHEIPSVPSDLGYYDLRVPESRQAQAELAREYGIEGFIYWHYWFGNGRRLLERPFNEVLKSGEPDFPFCLAWANHTWSGVWHGCPDRILIEQTYPGLEDIKAHFYSQLDAFLDPRYLKIDGRNVFCVYRPFDLPDAKLFIETWRELAENERAPGFYFIAIIDYPWDRPQDGYDAFTTNPPVGMLPYQGIKTINEKIEAKLSPDTGNPALPQIYAYDDFIENAFPEVTRREDIFPCVVPNWDNTPRSGSNGFALHGSTPELYGRHLSEAVELVGDRDPDQRVIFVKSWNEWAETNYLEPDLRWGKAYLEKTQEIIVDNGD